LSSAGSQPGYPRLPADYRIGIVAGSAHGAVEMALCRFWRRGVDVLAWESFGKGWLGDIVQQLRLSDLRKFEAPYGRLPDLPVSNLIETLSSPGMAQPQAFAFPPAIGSRPNAKGLVICDATSAVFAMTLPGRNSMS